MFDSFDSSAVNEGRCEKVAVGRDRKEASSSPSLRRSTELATDVEEVRSEMKVLKQILFCQTGANANKRAFFSFHEFLGFKGISCDRLTLEDCNRVKPAGGAVPQSILHDNETKGNNRSYSKTKTDNSSVDTILTSDC